MIRNLLFIINNYNKIIRIDNTIQLVVYSYFKKKLLSDFSPVYVGLSKFSDRSKLNRSPRFSLSFRIDHANIVKKTRCTMILVRNLQKKV